MLNALLLDAGRLAVAGRSGANRAPGARQRCRCWRSHTAGPKIAGSARPIIAYGARFRSGGGGIAGRRRRTGRSRQRIGVADNAGRRCRRCGVAIARQRRGSVARRRQCRAAIITGGQGVVRCTAATIREDAGRCTHTATGRSRAVAIKRATVRAWGSPTGLAAWGGRQRTDGIRKVAGRRHWVTALRRSRRRICCVTAGCSARGRIDGCRRLRVGGNGRCRRG
jgi:hypothetical protein